MSQEAVERLLGRLLTDDLFRKKAQVSIEKVCHTAGYHLTPGELQAIRQDDLIRFDLISRQLCGSIKRFASG